MSVSGGPDIVQNGLVLCLDAGNTKSYPGSGTTWTDLSRSGNNGTLTNGPTFSSGNGGSIAFDGSNDYVNCGTGLGISGGWTLCSFFKTSTSNTSRVILGRTGTGPSYSQNYVLYLNPSNKFTCQTSADSYKNAESITSVSTNTWYYACGVYNSSTKILSIYVNGSLEGSSTALIADPPTTGDQYVILGASNALDAANILTGNIALAKIYNRALSASEILQNYNATKARFRL